MLTFLRKIAGRRPGVVNWIVLALAMACLTIGFERLHASRRGRSRGTGPSAARRRSARLRPPRARVKKLAARTASSRTRGCASAACFLSSSSGVGHAVAPVAQHARRRGPGVEVGRAKHPLEQLVVDDVVRLMQPQRFEQVVLVLGILRVESRRSTSCGAAITSSVFAAAQLDAGPIADAVLRLLEQVEQLVDRLAGDLRRA